MKPSIALDLWVTENFDALRERLSLTGTLSDDALQDAYISLRDALTADPSQTVTDFGEALSEAYRVIRRRHVRHQRDEFTPDSRFFDYLSDNLSDDDPTEAQREKKDSLASDIRQFMKHKFPPSFIIMFETRHIQGASLRDVKDITGISTARCVSCLSQMTDVVKAKFHYAS